MVIVNIILIIIFVVGYFYIILIIFLQFLYNIDYLSKIVIEIGKNVWVTAGVEILCHERDLSYYEIGKPVKDCPLKKEKVIIKDGAHIGIGAIIMPGVTIGEGAIIGAGAVVTSNIPKCSIAVGVPAKIIKVFKEENIENLD